MRKRLAVIMLLPLFVIAAEWQSLNGPPAGRADDISMGWDPIHSYYAIYAADQSHKLYKSTNEGEYWDSIPTIPPNPNIVNPACVITAPNNAQIVYIGKSDATPVWKSEDGGQTWEPKSTGITNTQPLCFAMDPNNSSVVYLGCGAGGDKSVLFRTTDGGFIWRSLNLSGYDINHILAWNLSNEGVILILATDKGILSGKSYHDFKLVKDGEFTQICYNKKADKIYVKGNNKIWQSDDGKKWKIYQSNEPIDFSGIGDIIRRRRE